MSQRSSGYDRIEHDVYETPAWATHALVPHLPARVKHIHEPAAGSGKMVEALIYARPDILVSSADIRDGEDFFAVQAIGADAIVTNPPYSDATAFIEHALELMRPNGGIVAMLLRCDFDHAASRRRLFAECPAFDRKLILTRRIRWIEGSTGSPSFNHAFYIWDWRRDTGAPPAISYDFQKAA
jgi:hypothetical protein